MKPISSQSKAISKQSKSLSRKRVENQKKPVKNSSITSDLAKINHFDDKEKFNAAKVNKSRFYDIGLLDKSIFKDALK